MSPVRWIGPSCSCGCGRPARELDGLSTPCWMALTPAERLVVQEASQDTVEVDVSAVVAEAERITRRAA